eukprot:UN05854
MLAAQYKKVGDFPDTDLLDDLSDLIGLPNNKIPTIKDMDIYYDGDEFCGRYKVAARYAEAFLMEYGADVEVAWNSDKFSNPDDIYRYLQVWNYVWTIRNVPAYGQTYDSNLMLP